MKPSLLMDTVSARATAHIKGDLKRSTYIIGSPGLGKTQLTKQVAEALGIGFKALHAPLMQPEDYGMPVVNAARDGYDFVVSAEKFPLEHSECPDNGILLIDEMGQADNAGQKILANLLQEREIHGKHLKPGWHIVATGNRQQDRAGANRILSHLNDRITTYEMEPNLEDWCNWALDHGVKPEVISFLRFKSALLCDFNPQNEKSPTPRSWAEGVSNAIGCVPEAAEFETFKGDVGEGPAAEFVGYLKIARKLPNPDLILLNAEKYEVPKEPSVLYALAGALAHRAKEDNFERVMVYAKRMPPEFMVLTVRDAVRKEPACANTRAFTEWAVKEGAKVVM